jgi:hypothetical protein
MSAAMEIVDTTRHAGAGLWRRGADWLAGEALRNPLETS